MADNKNETKDKGEELCHISICKAENGYKISCNYEPKETLSSRAGWVPPMYCKPKEYVEKSKAAVIKRLEEVL